MPPIDELPNNKPVKRYTSYCLYCRGDFMGGSCDTICPTCEAKNIPPELMDLARIQFYSKQWIDSNVFDGFIGNMRGDGSLTFTPDELQKAIDDMLSYLRHWGRI